MPGVTRPGPARREEDALLGRPRQAAFLTAGVVAVTAVVFVLVADHGTLARIQRLDDAWLRLMISGRAPPLTAIAKVFNVLGLVYVTLPVRIALAGFLALRRRWWHLAAFAAAIVLSEVLIGSLKGIYDRTRPPGSLVATSGASFPSGHAIAASVTVVAAVIALVPAGRRRTLWGAAAVAFSIVMGLSRAYLARPLALRRHRRDPARHVLRPGHRPGSRPASAMAQQGAATYPAATPGWRSSAPPRREQQVRGMNMDRTHQSGTRLSDPPTAANEPSPGAPEPITKHAGRFLPSTRYRHPGDVIRLIGSGLVLTGMLAAVAVAPGRLTGPGAATVTWLGSDPAGRLLTGLVQVAFVLAAAAAVAAALRHRRFRLLAGLAAGAVTAGAALAGILYLAGDKHPHAVTAAGRA